MLSVSIALCCVCVCVSVCLSLFIRGYVIVGLNKTAVSEGSQSLNLKSPSALISETDKSPHSLPPAVAHIDTSLMTLPDSEPSARLSSQPPVTDGGASGELISKGLSLESSVDPPPLTTYMPSPLSSLTNTSSNVAMTLTGPIGNFSFNSQKLLSPAEFVSSPPHSLSSFSKITPTDFSSALPSVVSNTSVAAPATPTSVAVQTSVAPPPITTAEDSSAEVTLESSSNTDSDDEDDGDDDKVTTQEIIQSAEKNFQGISETLNLPQSEVNVSKMSAEVSISDAEFHREAVDGDSNKSVISQQKQTSEADGLSSPQQQQQKSELLQIEGRVSQASSDFASANDQESEYEDPTINVANNLVDTRPYSKPQSEVAQMTGQPINSYSDAQSINNNVQFLKCSECSTFNSPDVLKCSDCGCAKNDQWTPQNFLKAIASSQNSTEYMIAQCPSTVDVVAVANESSSAVESSAVDSNVTPISYTAATLLTAAPDHGRVSVDDGAVTESPRSSVVTLHTSSSLQAAAATGVATGVDKDTSQSSDITHLPSSTSVAGSSHSVNHQWLTRSVM